MVGRCPLCRVEERSLLHEGLWDNVFFSAPGRWTLWRCEGCRSAYLDPRPTAETIGLAYSRYYTHEEQILPQAVTPLQKLRAALGNGYRNARYGTRLQPSSALGRVAGAIVPPFRWLVDTSYRYLPNARRQGTRRVLDIGCGGGDWLLMAKEAGWEVAGADPDPVAQRRGAERGIEIRAGGAEAWEDAAGTFDFVTMSHVVEHVHDPVATLQTVYRLLKPGGLLFVDTPNIDAAGHDEFGPDWRGLEPPRHLVLFNRDSLTAALSRAGFTRIRYPLRLYPTAGLKLASRQIAAGLDPSGPEAPPGGARVHLLERFKGAFAGRKTEFLTALCEKPR